MKKTRIVQFGILAFALVSHVYVAHATLTPEQKRALSPYCSGAKQRSRACTSAYKAMRLCVRTRGSLSKCIGIICKAARRADKRYNCDGPGTVGNGSGKPGKVKRTTRRSRRGVSGVPARYLRYIKLISNYRARCGLSRIRGRRNYRRWYGRELSNPGYLRRRFNLYYQARRQGRCPGVTQVVQNSSCPSLRVSWWQQQRGNRTIRGIKITGFPGGKAKFPLSCFDSIKPKILEMLKKLTYEQRKQTLKSLLEQVKDGTARDELKRYFKTTKILYPHICVGWADTLEMSLSGARTSVVNLPLNKSLADVRGEYCQDWIESWNSGIEVHTRSKTERPRGQRGFVIIVDSRVRLGPQIIAKLSGLQATVEILRDMLKTLGMDVTKWKKNLQLPKPQRVKIGHLASKKWVLMHIRRLRRLIRRYKRSIKRMKQKFMVSLDTGYCGSMFLQQSYYRGGWCNSITANFGISDWPVWLGIRLGGNPVPDKNGGHMINVELRLDFAFVFNNEGDTVVRSYFGLGMLHQSLSYHESATSDTVKYADNEFRFIYLTTGLRWYLLATFDLTGAASGLYLWFQFRVGHIDHALKVSGPGLGGGVGAGWEFNF